MHIFINSLLSHIIFKTKNIRADMASTTCQITKSCELSDALRKEGNDMYSKRKFIDALVKYNASLCYSPAGSNLGHAYANRSAVCFEIKRYQECLENIKLARSNNYPKENFNTLKLREEKCREIIRKQKEKNDKWKFFKLSYKPNKFNPQIAEILELRNNEKFGRYIVTSSDIEVGRILAVEEPFCSVLLSQSKHVEVDANNTYQRCSSCCLKENILMLIPCTRCNCGKFSKYPLIRFI